MAANMDDLRGLCKDLELVINKINLLMGDEGDSAGGALIMNLYGGSTYCVTDVDFDWARKRFPGLNTDREIRNLVEWNNDQPPAKRKRTFYKFIKNNLRIKAERVADERPSSSVHEQAKREAEAQFGGGDA